MESIVDIIQIPTTELMNNDNMEILKKMEDEHFRLQRQVREIQTDRLHRSMGVHPQFRRHDKLLRVLKVEYLNLALDLKIASTGAHKKKDRRMKRELKRALLLRMKTDQNYDAGMTVINQLEELLQRDNKNRLQLQQLVNAKMGQIKERRGQSELRLVSTENRLENAMLRFNKVQWENKKIREEIEHMLKDRAIFNQAWGKMLNALSKGKKFLTDLFESSYLAYDQRDEWVTKVRSIQEKGKVDQMLQLQEMRDLQKAFDHDTKLYNFLAKKGVIRINRHQEEKEEMLKRRKEDEIQKEFDAHLKILEEITDYTKEEDPDKIIEKFRKTEQQNFSMYQMLTEYCAENVALKREVKQVRQVLKDRRDWNEQQDLRRASKLQRLQEMIDVQRQKNERLKREIEKKTQVIDNAVEKVAEMFKMLDCSLEPYENLLGDKFPSRWQLSLTLELMTEKINEYLETVYYSERILQKKSEGKTDKKTTSSLKKFVVYPKTSECWTATPIHAIVASEPCPACVEARWFSRVNDSPEVPFTREMTMAAIEELTSDPAYLRSDRIHPIVDCRVPSSRLILAARLMAQ